VQRYLHDPTFSNFDTIPECDRQAHTHRHTTTAYTTLSIASRGNKMAQKLGHWPLMSNISHVSVAIL